VPDLGVFRLFNRRGLHKFREGPTFCKTNFLVLLDIISASLSIATPIEGIEQPTVKEKKGSKAIPWGSRGPDPTKIWL